jgi:5-formyltetrahydrofolate cyclo-ligase
MRDRCIGDNELIKGLLIKKGIDAMNSKKKTKKEWRQIISKLKSDLPKEQWQKKSNDIHKLLLSEPLWCNAEHIALYLSVEKEVDTLAIIQQGWDLGKHIYLPKCHPEAKQLVFYRIESLDQLEVVYYGIPEPIPAHCEKLRLEELELIIVPGLAFDQRGYRIGYGGGYYDRFLSHLTTEVDTLSLAFSFQVLKRQELLPNDSFDIPVDSIMTEQGTFNCLNNRE